MSKEQADGDLLPYREVDRSLKPKLPLLAGVMGVSTQHALGSLIEFWDQCADPRELERIAAQSIAQNTTPELVLTADEVTRKFRVASGKTVDIDDLVELRLLEPRSSNAYRVRGMSRDFKPIMKRLVNRDNASKGGKKSAETRAATHGTAQPQGGKGSKIAPDPGSDDAQAPSEAEPKRIGSDNRSESEATTEAERNPNEQRSADSEQRAAIGDDGPPSPGVQFFEWFQSMRRVWAPEKAPPREDLDEFFIAAAERLRDTPAGTREALEVATKGYAKDPYWVRRALPWAGFVDQWARHVCKLTQQSMPLGVLGAVGS